MREKNRKAKTIIIKVIIIIIIEKNPNQTNQKIRENVTLAFSHDDHISISQWTYSQQLNL